MGKKVETRGRPPKPPSEKFILTSVRMKPTEKDEILEASERKGVSYSDYVRGVALRYARASNTRVRQ